MRTVITGARGFLGSWLVYELRGRGRGDIELWKGDLLRAPLELRGGDTLIHLAAYAGGIGLNQASPADMLERNLGMALAVFRALREAPGARALLVGSVCAYPERPEMPIREDTLWDGYPEPTNAPYGIAKRCLVEMAKAYREQYGVRSVVAMPANLYGPADHFEPDRSHVVPALIRRMSEARASGAASVKLWGTGTATRDFLYVRDAARMLVDLIDRADWDAEPPPVVNLGTGTETSIAQLAAIVARATDYRGGIEWDTSRPDGQPRRVLDTSRADALGIKATTPLALGIAETVEWYQTRRT
jgi:GDP-L-fucose synthase